jgi:hypothetical protein
MVRGSAFYFGDAVTSDNASFPNFYQWVKNNGSDIQWPFILREGNVEIKRRIFCDLTTTHFYGIFLSSRNAEFQHFVRREGNRVIVEAVSTNGNPPIEMNFFAIRRDSNKGIFSHYLGSYRFQQFLSDLWASYRYFVESKKVEALDGLTEQAADLVRPQYSLREKCNYSPLYTPGTFENLINNLGTISEVRMTTYQVDDQADRAVSNNLTSVHKVYRLNEVRVDGGVRGWLREKRAQSLRLLASGRTVHSGSVIGEGNDGRELNINFENTIEDYLECQYDDIGTFEVTNLAEHRIIADMFNQMNNSIIFRPAQNR